MILSDADENEIFAIYTGIVKAIELKKDVYAFSSLLNDKELDDDIEKFICLCKIINMAYSYKNYKRVLIYCIALNIVKNRILAKESLIIEEITKKIFTKNSFFEKNNDKESIPKRNQTAIIRFAKYVSKIKSKVGHIITIGIMFILIIIVLIIRSHIESFDKSTEEGIVLTVPSCSKIILPKVISSDHESDTKLYVDYLGDKLKIQNLSDIKEIDTAFPSLQSKNIYAQMSYEKMKLKHNQE